MNQRMEGSYLVETALVMVVALMILLGIICLGLRLHDMAVIKMTAVQMLIGEEEDPQQIHIRENTLLPSRVSYQRGNQWNQRQVSYSGTIVNPLKKFLRPIFVNDQQRTEGEVAYRYIAPSVFLRLCRMIRLSGGEGG